VLVRRSDGQVTRPDACGSAVCLCGSPRPNDYPPGLRIALFHSRCISLIFLFFGAFSRICARVLGLFHPFVHFISFPSILLHLLHYFQFYLTDNIYNILEYIFVINVGYS